MSDDSIRIVVAQRGFIYVGHVTRDGDMLRIDGARCIRIWGTTGKTSGLGSLATGGPTKDTVLEDPSTVEVHILGVVLSHRCNAAAWKKAIP